MYGNNLAIGTIEGTGEIIRVECGFQPQYVKCVNIDDAGSLWPVIEWIYGMGNAYGLKSLKVVDNGTTGNAINSMITSLGITPYAGQKPGDVMTGTVAMSLGGTSITGTSTEFLTELKVGQKIKIGGQIFTVTAIASKTAATVSEAAVAAASGAKAYNMTGFGEGFLIGKDTDMNVSGETILYVAAR